MKYYLGLLSSLLLVSSTIAVPTRHDPGRRRFGSRASRAGQFKQSVVNGIAHTVEAAESQNEPQKSSNWAGALYSSPLNNDPFTSVSASFTIVKPQLPVGVTKNSGVKYCASTWVGIDGDTSSSALLQTGVDSCVDDNGRVTFDAWYEWLPLYATDFDNIAFSVGDVVEMSVKATSSTSGIATIINTSTNTTATQVLTAPSNSVLKGENAEWIVEDFQQSGALVPLVNFGSVVFTNAKYGTQSGETGTASGASLIEMVGSDGTTVQTAQKIDGDRVSVDYVLGLSV